jgi:sporulation protein YhbH
MVLKIEQDYSRFKLIVRGKIRKNLRKYLTNDELIGKKGDDLISIPIPQIEIPSFTYGSNPKKGVGSGKGEVGDPLGQGQESEESSAGNAPGFHILEVDISLDELAEIMGEELELPRIQPKGKSNIISYKTRYSSINTTGPDSLIHRKRTYKQTLKRQILMGQYSHRHPVVFPVREDRRYRSWKEEKLPERNAVIIYMMDVSGSMGQEQKEIVRVESFWIDTWLRSQYDGLETRYIIHDAVAREVDQHTFYHTRESGGTIISSAYKSCLRLIDEQFDPYQWNIYAFHFSDGDNWSSKDTQECLNLLNDDLLGKLNMFCYGQVESEYGSGQFIHDLDERFKGKDDRVVSSRIENKDKIFDSIKEFLGKGH